MYLIKVDPNTRINDQFIYQNIDCRPPGQDLVSALVGKESANTTRYHASFYEKIALDIVTETVFDYPYPYISEKTLRPIACKRMFVIIGPKHMIKFLHDCGFKTWNDIIDESYDSIEDPQKRLLTLMQTIKDFCNIPLDQVRAYLKNNQEILDYNFQVLKQFKYNDLIKISKLLNKEN